MMTITLTQTLIPPHPTNRVFDLDPALGKCAIEADILDWSIFAAPLAARGCAQAMRMPLRDPNVGPLADCADPFWQTLQQPRLFEQRQISRRSDHALWHI